ncbi:hypothetical protein [Trinickia acidisoli]|uniref:hypothetical protein n=1 Tax=Trinickia acidisoli TaxID=2767482 RepID=UPI001A8E6CF8|nr:hypothetical protein [Trinickia acidisoli]
MSAIEDSDRFISNMLSTALTTFVVIMVFEFIEMADPQIEIASPIGELAYCAGISTVICFAGPWLRLKLTRRPGPIVGNRTQRSGVVRARFVGLLGGIFAGAMIMMSVRY